MRFGEAVQCHAGPPEVRRLRPGAGFHYCKTMLSRIQMMLKLETDPSEILNELIYACRKVTPVDTCTHSSLFNPVLRSPICGICFAACCTCLPDKGKGAMSM